MSDIEEVVIPKRGRPATKPEIAREKLKEKRERLKKEKDNLIIEEAKKRLIIEAEEKVKQEAETKRIEEEKKKNDPNFILMQEIANLRKMLEAKTAPAPAPVQVQEKPKRQYKRKPKTEVVVEEVPKPKPSKPARKPRNRTVYEESPSNNFVGNAPEPPAQYVQYMPTNPLLNHLLGRRNMNSIM